ncbi:hypothetical protein A3718_14970 [Erythrobacter sp. HI0019]|uniref:hypothetical protein n=1 Tax=unclassified Erythrobacter TaxID=2633097 RepID=UPI0007B9415B|nr:MULTISPECIES: hypothetical protein [unclassified Erythrobacter]KZX91124.1 hypothetical protein A3718_14970 [Erythrobacter sp. HI0019]KZY09395.1 hypothetical protein A3723_10025 [Erythrobacter sp. HI0028]
MSPGEIASVASAIVAFAALIISGVSLHKSNKTNARQDELNRLLIERETRAGRDTKRADLSANIITLGTRNHRLKVFNRGKATARNVRLIDLQEEVSVLAQNVIRQKFPVPILEQHQSVEVPALQLSAGPARAHIKLIWDDEAGSDHEKELTPSF